MELTLVLIIILIFSLITIFILYIRLYASIENRARLLFGEWKREELEIFRDEIVRQAKGDANNQFSEWKRNEENKIRQDAITRSHSVIRGKITEHLIPFSDSFPYNPRDARFLGTPMDLLVFNGLSEGEIIDIIFIEVKSGSTAKLSHRERMVRDAVNSGRVKYEIIRTSERGDQ